MKTKLTKKPTQCLLLNTSSMIKSISNQHKCSEKHCKNLNAKGIHLVNECWYDCPNKPKSILNQEKQCKIPNCSNKKPRPLWYSLRLEDICLDKNCPNLPHKNYMTLQKYTPIISTNNSIIINTSNNKKLTIKLQIEYIIMPNSKEIKNDIYFQYNITIQLANTKIHTPEINMQNTIQKYDKSKLIKIHHKPESLIFTQYNVTIRRRRPKIHTQCNISIEPTKDNKEEFELIDLRQGLDDNQFQSLDKEIEEELAKNREYYAVSLQDH